MLNEIAATAWYFHPQTDTTQTRHRHKTQAFVAFECRLRHFVVCCLCGHFIRCATADCNLRVPVLYVKDCDWSLGAVGTWHSHRLESLLHPLLGRA